MAHLPHRRRMEAPLAQIRTMDGGILGEVESATKASPDEAPRGGGQIEVSKGEEAGPRRARHVGPWLGAASTQKWQHHRCRVGPTGEWAPPMQAPAGRNTSWTAGKR
eukprot:2993205-Pyramimonas_sp.AAC.1